MLEAVRSGGKIPEQANMSNCMSLRDLAAEYKGKGQEDDIKKQLMKEEILIRIQETTKLIHETSSKPVDESNGGSNSESGHIEKMEWDSLYELSANVMDDYTRHVDSILADLDQLYQVCSVL